jgi:hypothetical protein
MIGEIDHDLVHGRQLYRPDSKDIDLYRVPIDQTGILRIETFAERQLESSTLDTVVTLYLKNKGRPSWPAAIPAVFMMGSALTAMWVNLRTFAPGGARQDRLLLTVGGVLFALGVWLLIESILALRPSRSPEAKP